MPDTPQETGVVTFTKFRFSDLNVGDVFYYNEDNDTDKNPAHRKQATDKCLLIGEQKEYFAEDGDIVFVKEY
tara:strand:+ start:2823 stop:3038 length:216 start_codon:yes stop_codon:yes gene_type:complete